MDPGLPWPDIILSPIASSLSHHLCQGRGTSLLNVKVNTASWEGLLLTVMLGGASVLWDLYWTGPSKRAHPHIWRLGRDNGMLGLPKMPGQQQNTAPRHQLPTLQERVLHTERTCISTTTHVCFRITRKVSTP